MGVDHSKTYTELKLRNIPHVLRKRMLIREVSKLPKHTALYGDFGCSNGYLTNAIAEILSAKSSRGFDHSDNIEIARSVYPHIDFDHLDLNKVSTFDQKFGVVTCFETLEHVGNIQNALKTIKMPLQKIHYFYQCSN